jgi:hypothetical protein
MGHTEVKDQHIRLIVIYRFECLHPILAAGKDLKVLFQTKKLLQGIENKGMVVSQYEANWHCTLQAAQAAT